ncbi:MAG: hypothetical protein J6K45_04695 [Clostridia bacterium]|nr:hypothetical protein [Clostridia bacterium]
MIEEIREYIAKCPYLKEYGELNIEYLTDKVNTYSINESAGYNPVINNFLVGSEMQFLFTFDSKLRWNEDIQNNIDNSKFFENFRNWLEENNNKKIFPNIKGIYKIEALTNGYIHVTNANEAIYRIQCKIEYFKRRKS